MKGFLNAERNIQPIRVRKKNRSPYCLLNMFLGGAAYSLPQNSHRQFRLTGEPEPEGDVTLRSELVLKNPPGGCAQIPAYTPTGGGQTGLLKI